MAMLNNQMVCYWYRLLLVAKGMTTYQIVDLMSYFSPSQPQKIVKHWSFLCSFPRCLTNTGKGSYNKREKVAPVDAHHWPPSEDFSPLSVGQSFSPIAMWHCHNNILYLMWRFPKVGVPLNHPFIDRFSIINHPAIGYLHLWKPPIGIIHNIDRFSIIIQP